MQISVCHAPRAAGLDGSTLSVVGSARGAGSVVQSVLASGGDLAHNVIMIIIIIIIVITVQLHYYYC